MSNSNTTNHRFQHLLGVVGFTLLGVLSGIAWLAALSPVQVTGAVGYDLSRYGFGVGVFVVLSSLLFRSGREYGMGLFLMGLVLGVICSAALKPLPPGGGAPPIQILFGFLLGIIVLTSLVFFLACWACSRPRHQKRRREGGAIAPAAAPRRFGMGTLMIIVLALSLVFAMANWLDLPPALSIWAGGFLVIIGGLQMLMNNAPRAASVGTGAVLLPLTVATAWALTGLNSRPQFAAIVATPADIVFAAAHLAAFGAVCGYIGGVAVAGLFFVIDQFRRLFGRCTVSQPTS